MSEASRQRRLHVENRLAELNAKYGPLPETPLPPRLDSLETAQADAQAAAQGQEPPPATETPEGPSAQKRVLDASEALLQLDRFGETPLYACPLCGEESAKASTALGIWHCTACEHSGWIQRPGFEPTRIEEV